MRLREERIRMVLPGARSNTRGEALKIPRFGQNSQKITENELFLVYTAAAVLPRLRKGTDKKLKKFLPHATGVNAFW